jgi:hypothetical protein
MKDSNKTQNANAKTLGLALAAFLLPAAASANGPVVVKKDLSGHVEVVHQMPGGTVVVGADWGKPKPAPQVVVVKESPKVIVVKEQPKVVVVEKRGQAYGHRNREVTVIHQAPRRQVTIIKHEPVRREVTIVKTEPVREKVVVVEKRNSDSQYYNDGKQVSYQHNGPDGAYHYYEDANQISIQDNRDGRQRNVYVRK